MWYKYAKPGDKVVAIDAGVLKVLGTGEAMHPQPGTVYTILSVEISPFFDCGVGFDIKELSENAGYSANCFRPIQPKSTETGMSTLKGILNGQRVPEVA
jgi:hypothetical protein